MIDKQIIIDGVDVNGCEYCLKMTKYRCAIQWDVHKCLCEENPNCYYKQFKRKEQECEELKKTIMYKCPRCGDEYLSPIGASLYEENNKLKQALDEIENIAKRYCKE